MCMQGGHKNDSSESDPWLMVLKMKQYIIYLLLKLLNWDKVLVFKDDLSTGLLNPN